MRDYFEQLATHVFAGLSGSEVALVSGSGETSDFVRLNRGLVRQSGSVKQAALSISLLCDGRDASGSTTISGDPDADTARLTKLTTDLRETLPHVPENPYQTYNDAVESTEHVAESRVPKTPDTLDQIRAAAGDHDLVGILANGVMWSGFANSLGQRNWKETWNYNFDWSLYHQADKAVKNGYSGFEWDEQAFADKMTLSKEQLRVMTRAPKSIRPGMYRAYLAPSALCEVISMMSWGGFSLRARRTRTTPLLHLIDGKDQFDASVHMDENIGEGIAPNFERHGFLSPDRIPLIRGGEAADSLVSPRSALEFDETTNGANGMEAPGSMDMAGGDIAKDSVLTTLGDGLYIGNLWYLNFSDRQACRTTGVTRFGTFWVEGGELVAPVSVMRFDESVYRALGDNLEGLTTEREFQIDPGTYGGRTYNSVRLPGAIIGDFSLTL